MDLKVEQELLSHLPEVYVNFLMSVVKASNIQADVINFLFSII